MGRIEAVCERGNRFKAYERVVKNQGAAVVDGIEITDLKARLQKDWPALKGHLMAGTSTFKRLGEQGMEYKAHSHRVQNGDTDRLQWASVRAAGVISPHSIAALDRWDRLN